MAQQIIKSIKGPTDRETEKTYYRHLTLLVRIYAYISMFLNWCHSFPETLNPLEASVEKKLYLNFAKWLKYVFVDGKPTARKWVDIMQSQTPELSPPSIPEEYYAGGDSSSPIVLD